MTARPFLAPGSTRARAAGCTCSSVQPALGGADLEMTENDARELCGPFYPWYIAAGCPTHPPRRRRTGGDIEKPIKRRTRETVRDGSARRRLIVTLYPSDVIGLRPERTRREERITVASIYERAVAQRVAQEKAARRAKRKARQ